MPDGKSISVVRVEADGTQRLWKFSLAGGGPSLILEDIKPVGYHLWVNDYTLALFVLGKPNTLQLVDLRSGKAEVIADNPGRILRPRAAREQVQFRAQGFRSGVADQNLRPENPSCRNLHQDISGR